MLAPRCPGDLDPGDPDPGGRQASPHAKQDSERLQIRDEWRAAPDEDEHYAYAIALK
jgi:hypothetical protein